MSTVNNQTDILALCAASNYKSFRDAPLGAGPESILPVVVMDSGLALRAPRNDGVNFHPGYAPRIRAAVGY